MTNQNTEIVVSNQAVNLKEEARKQLRIAMVDSLHCSKKPAKDFADCAVEYLWNRMIDWVNSKLSA